MSQVKLLLDSLLWEIYGQQQRWATATAKCRHHHHHHHHKRSCTRHASTKIAIVGPSARRNVASLHRLSIRKLADVCAILKVEIRLMGGFLERAVIQRDHHRRRQELLCEFVTAVLHVLDICILHGYYDAHPQMRFNLTPPPMKATSYIADTNSSAITTIASTASTAPTATISAADTTASNFNHSLVNNNHSNGLRRNNNNNNHNRATMQTSSSIGEKINGGSNQADGVIKRGGGRAAESVAPAASVTAQQEADEAASDYQQWLHAMKLVARLPGGMPPEFRRKLWLSLADKYLKSKKVDWDKEEEKCFCEKWREDDEELGIQIVKDLHRTGSNLCTGPAATINQAKLKRILLGYARYNPEVGYCQGFNMLGALILQVMDKEEAESIKVMIYLVEGVLPPGYFCGSMGGLQADMGVFRELMQQKLPRLAKHLQKLQGPIENAFEPPLTNVFTMQWFLTMFCTCLPMTCVLRVWDLVLIEGSDVLLRTALVLWSLLEDRVLKSRSADDFYCKMGSFSSELLNGHLIDSNGLIERVVQLGPIPDIQKLRDKHLYNIAPLRHKQGLQLYYDDEEPESEEESQLAVATAWGLPWGRRGSQSQPSGIIKPTNDSKDRIALDISLLKKQYDRLRERQKQAHIILTTACSTARNPLPGNANQNVSVNQLLVGRSAIVTKGRRVGAPLGAIPPARKPSLPNVLQHRPKPPEKQLRRGETIHWRDTDTNDKRRRDSLTWKEIRAERAAGCPSDGQPRKIRSRIGKSDSSSYSEESDDEEVQNASSTDTSLCDEDDPPVGGDKSHSAALENSPKRIVKLRKKCKEKSSKLKTAGDSKRPKSWAPSGTDIPFTLLTSDSPVHNVDVPKHSTEFYEEPLQEEEDSTTECDRVSYKIAKTDWPETNYSPIAGDLAITKLGPLHVHTDTLEVSTITSTSQLSPMPDVSGFLKNSSISPLPTLKPSLYEEPVNSLGSGDGDGENGTRFDVSDDGVTNQYFERVNSVERPNKLDLFHSLNKEESIGDDYKVDENARPTTETYRTESDVDTDEKLDIRVNVAIEEEKPIIDRRMELLIDYSERKSSACIAEATSEFSSMYGKGNHLSNVRSGGHRLSSDFSPLSRDDNVPEDKKTDYRESIHSELNPRQAINRRHTLNSASKKRKDPRRLTRSTTIEMEECFQALEKQINGPNYAMVNPPSNTRIPSTKDLEDKFNRLSKLRFDGSDYDAEPLPKSQRERLPSSADLENRVEKLERQMSSQKVSPKKSGDMKSEENASTNSKEQKRRRSDFDETEMQDAKDQTESDTRNRTVEHSTDEDRDRPRLKKLPSTAELEDRFNALERRFSEQKNTYPSKKKEPPDEMESRKEADGRSREASEHRSATNDGNKSATTSKQIKKDEHDTSKEKTPEEENSPRKDRSKRLEKDEHAADMPSKKLPSSPSKDEPMKEKERPLEDDGQKTTEKLSPAKGNDPHSEAKKAKKTLPKDHHRPAVDEQQEEEIIKQPEEDATSTKQKIETSPARKKSPPTTEELEKRFQAMEKQLSSATPEVKTKQQDRADRDDIKTGEDEEKSTAVKSRVEERQESEEIKKQVASEENVESTQEQNDESNRKIIQRDEKKEKEINREVKKTTESDGSKRRASEPPTTEELEKRYETLTRRMSTKNFIEKSPGADVVVKGNEIKKIPEERTQRTHVQRKETLKKQSQSEYKEADESEAQPEVSSATKLKTESVQTSPIETAVETNDARTSRVHQPLPPPAPPMPIESLVANDPNHHQRRALIEEFQSKIKTQPSDENLKPSDINPKRKTPGASLDEQSHPAGRADDTLETHAADTAFYRSANYESWRGPPTMVRRFSDLPSRADLENRLQFLEQKLSKKFYKQRCASDSEVASRRHRLDEHGQPGTSTKTHNIDGDDLEKRVQALEKQLSENSLKLLEAMRAKAEESPTVPPLDRRLSTETIDATGKELVRYSHFGEMEDNDPLKPINISINIKMRLNRPTEEETRRRAETLPTADEIEKRLKALEQQLIASRSTNNSLSIDVDSENVETPKNSKAEEVSSTVSPADIMKPKRDKDCGDAEDEIATGPEVEETPAKCNEDKSIHEEKEQIVTEPTAAKEKRDSKRQEEIVNNVRVEEKTEIQTKSSEKCEKLEKSESHEMKKSDQDLNHFSEEEKPTRVERKAPKESEKVEGTATENSAAAINKDISAEAATDQPVEIKDGELSLSNVLPDKMVINSSDIGPMDPKNKTLVLLLDNEPKAVKVRRLTRANTEELESLFEALEKQLSDRNLIKSEDGKLKRIENKDAKVDQKPTKESEEISSLTKEIEQFTSADQKKTPTVKEVRKGEEKPENEEYDWGPNPIKIHLKRKTVYLPSTKELEARFRSLERQIKLLDEVEKIDVEHRLNEIERKIKLQYSLSHEKDLSKYLELCEGKGLDDTPESSSSSKIKEDHSAVTPKSPIQGILKTPRTSPTRSRSREKTPHSSPGRNRSRSKSPCSCKHSPYTSPARHHDPEYEDNGIPSTEDLEYRYRALDLKSRDNSRAKKKDQPKKQPIHPLEMLLDPSPDEKDIPTTGELEHRMRVLEEKRTSPSPQRKSRSRSPARCGSLERPEPPTADELEARMRALEEEQQFDFRMQKKLQEFNDKLKNVVSPSVSYEEASHSREHSPQRCERHRPITPKSFEDSQTHCRAISPKVLRFRNDEEERRPWSRTDPPYDFERMVGSTNAVLETIQENSKMLERILQKTLTGSSSSIAGALTSAAVTEGLDAMGTRLMKETSPLRRTGTHTGVPLRTGENINERLNSIKDTIKSIDTLCEEKPYRREKCERYIDSLFNDSLHFQHKKSSLEDLRRSRSRSRLDYAPSIRVSDHSERPSDYHLTRSIGSAESIRATSPLRSAEPLHHRSNRDLCREVSPRLRREEDREEYESRVRRDNMLPIYFHDNHSDLSRDRLTKSHNKVDSRLDSYNYGESERSYSRSASRSPLRSPYGSREAMTMLHNTTTPANNNNNMNPTRNYSTSDFDRSQAQPVSPYRQTSHNLLGYESLKRSYTPVYNPGKLEIRHTTVTSTFYDRILTEKKLEKTLTRPASKSPVVSPSVPPRSYLDPLAPSADSNTKASPKASPTSAEVRSILATAQTPARSSYDVSGGGGPYSSLTANFNPNVGVSMATTSIGSYSFTPSNYSQAATTTISIPPLTASSYLPMTTQPVASSTASLPPMTSISFMSSPLPISTAVTSLPLSFTAFSYAPMMSSTLSSSFEPSSVSTATAPISTTIAAATIATSATTATSAVTATSSDPSTTGFYNPLMPLTLRQAPNFGATFGIFQSSLTNPNTTANKLPKT